MSNKTAAVADQADAEPAEAPAELVPRLFSLELQHIGGVDRRWVADHGKAGYGILPGTFNYQISVHSTGSVEAFDRAAAVAREELCEKPLREAYDAFLRTQSVFQLAAIRDKIAETEFELQTITREAKGLLHKAGVAIANLEDPAELETRAAAAEDRKTVLSNRVAVLRRQYKHKYFAVAGELGGSLPPGWSNCTQGPRATC